MCIKITDSELFKKGMLSAIILNSISFSIADYSSVDSTGNLSTVDSWRNSLLAIAEIIFVAIFSGLRYL